MKISQVAFCFVFSSLFGMESSLEKDLNANDDRKNSAKKKLVPSLTTTFTSTSIGDKVTSKVLSPFYCCAHPEMAWKTLATCKDFDYKEGGQQAGVTAAAFIDADTFVIGTTQGTMHVGDLKGGRVAKTIKAHTKKINGIVVSSDRKLILTVSHDKEAAIYCTEKLEGNGQRLILPDEVTCGALSSDGCHVLLGTTDGKAYLGDLKTMLLVKTFDHNQEKQQVHAVAFFKNNRIATACMDHTVRLWNSETGDCDNQWNANLNFSIFLAAALSPLENFVLMSFKGVVKVIPLTNEAPNPMSEKSIFNDEKNGRCITFSNDGKFILIGSEDKHAQLFFMKDKNTIEHLVTLNTHNNTVRAVAISPDKSTIICGDSEPPIQAGAKGSLKVWTIKDRAKELELDSAEFVLAIPHQAQGTAVSLPETKWKRLPKDLQDSLKKKYKVDTHKTEGQAIVIHTYDMEL